jgi:hypothetical protein
MRVMRRRASFISAPVVFTHSCKMASARGLVSIGDPLLAELDDDPEDEDETA